MAHPGDRFGPYELTERLVAEGAFEHWMAVRADGTQREPTEVEIRLSVRPSDEIALSALRGEYNALRILADARIVRPVSFFAQQAAIALEYQEGVTLEEVIEAARQRLIQVDLATTADIGLELATGAGFKRIRLWLTALGLFLVGIPSVFIGLDFGIDIAMHPETHFD